MLGLHAFPALRRLFVAQQSLSRLQGLEACPLLEARPEPATRRAVARACPSLLTRSPLSRACGCLSAR